VPETGNNRDQALQNSFSFIRGNRDVVVENLKISSKFTATNSTCASLLSDTASPCYYGEILGDIFHSNPVIVSFPENTRYKLAQDAGSAVPGAYSDRGKSYGTFFTDHRRRRKILYSGADDAYLHAVDAGVFNADTASFPGQYSLGSGREIFGYAPRSAVQKVYQLTHTIVQDWTVDGAPAFDDVFVDVTRAGATPAGVLSSESCAPSCTDSTHAWRTVVVGVTREAGTPVTPGSGGGGGVVFALDVTDPDLPANMNETASGGAGAPQCLVNSFTPGSSSPPAGCSSPFPRILWELADNQASSSVAPQPAEGILSLQSTTQDLGHTWSRPVIGRIKVKVGSQNTDFFVAIFGGGYSHTGASLAETNVSGGTGNFLYMADIETGKIIYKRNLGSFASNASATVSTGNLPAGAPGEPGVVDINFDGYVDRVFIGDTQGRLWKVDISSPADLVGGLIASSQWNPTLFFDEYQATTAADFAAKFPGQVRQPIFGRPSIFPIGTTGTGNAKLGVAVGTGDRDNMPALTDTRNNSFLVVVDEPGTITYPVFQFKSGGGSDLTAASFTLPTPCTAANCLNGKGYYLTLPVGSGGAQIVNTNPLVFNRVIYFNAFLRGTSVSACGSPGGKAFIYKVDFATGLSLILDTNGNPVLPSAETGDTMVASDPIIFDSKVGSALSDTSFKQIGGGQPPTVKVKSWKEQ
jgi:Tfp pilus tip-associated adhesin PilY1